MRAHWGRLTSSSVTGVGVHELLTWPHLALTWAHLTLTWPHLALTHLARIHLVARVAHLSRRILVGVLAGAVLHQVRGMLRLHLANLARHLLGWILPNGWLGASHWHRAIPRE